MYILTHCSTKLSLDLVFIIFALIQGLLISHALVLCPPKLHHNERTQNAMNKTTSSGGRQTCDITNNLYKNKHHPQSDGSNWHPLL